MSLGHVKLVPGGKAWRAVMVVMVDAPAGPHFQETTAATHIFANAEHV
jgi:hypothetical protein